MCVCVCVCVRICACDWEKKRCSVNYRNGNQWRKKKKSYKNGINEKIVKRQWINERKKISLSLASSGSCNHKYPASWEKLLTPNKHEAPKVVLGMWYKQWLFPKRVTFCPLSLSLSLYLPIYLSIYITIYLTLSLYLSIYLSHTHTHTHTRQKRNESSRDFRDISGGEARVDCANSQGGKKP